MLDPALGTLIIQSFECMHGAHAYKPWVLKVLKYGIYLGLEEK